MEKNDAIRKLLGLSQLQAAMLFDVSRSQWSMFELGKRSLPLHATLLLTDLLNYIKPNEDAAKMKSVSEKEALAIQLQFEKLLRENEYQQLTLDRKIAKLEQKQLLQNRLSQVAGFLNSQQHKIELKPWHNLIIKKGAAPRADTAATLESLKLRQEVLKIENLLIQSKMVKTEEIRKSDSDINRLTTIAECDVLLAWAANQKADLSYKKLTEEHAHSDFSEMASGIDKELKDIIPELQAVETLLAVLPEGLPRVEFNNKKNRLVYKKSQLETRKESYGTVALLGKEMHLNRTLQEIEVLDSFVVKIEEHRKTLTA